MQEVACLRLGDKCIRFIITDNVKSRVRSKTYRGRVYTWEERRLEVFLPKEIDGNVFIIIPIK